MFNGVSMHMVPNEQPYIKLRSFTVVLFVILSLPFIILNSIYISDSCDILDGSTVTLRSFCMLYIISLTFQDMFSIITEFTNSNKLIVIYSFASVLCLFWNIIGTIALVNRNKENTCSDNENSYLVVMVVITWIMWPIFFTNIISKLIFLQKQDDALLSRADKENYNSIMSV